MSRPVKMLWRITFAGIIGCLLLIVAVNFGLFGPMPSVEQLQDPTTNIASEIFAEDGTLMGKYFTEDRTPVEMKDISRYVVDALIATEDKRFYKHSGIDAEALGRSVKGMLTFQPEGGGSTITQQLALNLFGEQRATSTWGRFQQKLKEWIIAVKLERNFTKDEIITYYLNTVPFSENVFGIRNASITFFQKEPSRLTVEEAALLVAMVNGPSLFNPNKNPLKALERRNLILNRMVVANKLPAEEAEVLKKTPIRLNFKKLDVSESIAPYMRESVLKSEVIKMLANLVKADGKPYDINKDGLKIYTSINPLMQEYAEQAVAQNMALQQKEQDTYNAQEGQPWAKYPYTTEALIRYSARWNAQQQAGFLEKENRKTFDVERQMKVFSWNIDRQKDTVMTPLDSIKYTRQFLQAGFLAMDPNTGWVKAWVGGINYKNFKLDRASIHTKRQIGSAIKPILFTQGLEEAGITPETPYQANSQHLYGFNSQPSSSNTKSSITIWQGLNMANLPTAKFLMEQIGAKNFITFLKNCNIQTSLDTYEALAFGNFEISLFEASWMYTMYAGKGFNTKPQMVTRIEDHNGNVLVQMQQNRKPVISELTAYAMCKLMRDNTVSGKNKQLNNYKLKVEVASQTGKTMGNDNWFVAFTPELLCGSWVGMDDSFLKMADSKTQLALPNCGLFLQSVYTDKRLGFDANAKFSKPFIEKNNILKDWIDSTREPLKELPVPYRGNGKVNDYIATDSTAPKKEMPDIHLQSYPSTIKTDTLKKKIKMPST